jgi:hypothetical protein
MAFKCPFCPRYFSTRSAYTQHKKRCIPSTNNNNDSEELEEFKLKSNDHDIEVRNRNY